MIQQIKWIKEFCDKEGFNFINCDEIGVKIPCALDKGYKKNDQTIFIQGFHEGSKRITISYGGLKNQMSLKKPIDKWDIVAVKKHCIPDTFICAKCGVKNLNLRTQDNHKTYVCPKCYKEIDNAKSQTQADKKSVAIVLSILILLESFMLLNLSNSISYSKYNPLSWIETYNYKKYQIENGYEWDDIRRLDDGRYQHKTCSLTNFPMVIYFMNSKPQHYISTHYSKEICTAKGGEWEWEYMIPVITL